jgi:hypothetical protein
MLVLECILPEPVTPQSPEVEMDLVIMVNTNGRERTKKEYQHLFQQSGLKLNKVIETFSSCKILEVVSSDEN